MFRSHEMLPSRAMGRQVHLWRYGHWGRPLVVFPTAAGFAHEWELHGMVEALAPFLEGGHLKLYCTESNVAQAWTRKEEHPAEKIRHHLAYERYLIEDLVPFIDRDCGGQRLPIGVTGCSLGASYAANFALKHPDVFRWALCLSGRYQMRNFTGGFSNGDIFFHNPLDYLPGLEGEDLERVRTHTHLTLVCGQGAWEEGCIEETIGLGELLERKRIPYRRDLWGRDVSHEWPWWRRQAVFHLKRLLS